MTLSPVHHLQRWVVERPGRVVLTWLMVFAVAIPIALQVDDRLVVAGVVRGGEAAAVDDILALEFAHSSRNVLMLVVSGVPGIRQKVPPGVQSLVDRIEALPPVNGTRWHTPRKGGEKKPADTSTALLLVQLHPTADAMALLPVLRDLTTTGLTNIRELNPDSVLRWTGDSAIKEAIIRSSNEDLRRSELRAMPLTLVLLLIAFGSLAASLMPVFIGFMAIVMTLSAAFFLAGITTLSVMVHSVAALLGLALGIDYSLLIINRFRELRIIAGSRRQAVLQAMRTGGRTIVISGCAVAIGFLGLTLVPVDQMRSIAFAGMLVALFAVLLATSLVPALLALFGQKINFGQFRWRRFEKASHDAWRRWAAFVCRHPIKILVASSVPLFLLAFSAQRMSSSFPEESWLPANTEAVQALRIVEGMDEGNMIKRIKVLFLLPDSVRATDGSGMRGLRLLHRHLNQDERSSRVRSFLSFAGSSPSMRSVAGKLPDEITEHYISRDESAALLEFIPRAELDQAQLTPLVDELRSMDAASLTGLDGSILVGGLPAAAVDYERSIRSWFPLVILAVSLGSFLVLSIAFRSLLVPLKAVLLNLLAVFAAYGALVLVFVDGIGVGLFGLDAPIQAVFPATPVLVFCAAFGISMDYEVFLIARIAEARRAGHDDSAAIIEGVARTGPLITSAAAIMVTIFCAFALGDVLPTQILGFALAAVVALDALLIRVALGPAMIRIAGRFNWWPGS